MTTERSMKLLHNLFECNFKHHVAGFAQAQFKKHKFWFAYNYRFHRMCFNRKNCLNLSFHEEVCLDSNIRLIKTVRIRLTDVEELLEDSKIRVVVLHRDPRGVMNSRMQKKWCSK